MGFFLKKEEIAETVAFAIKDAMTTVSTDTTTKELEDRLEAIKLLDEIGKLKEEKQNLELQVNELRKEMKDQKLEFDFLSKKKSEIQDIELGKKEGELQRDFDQKELALQKEHMSERIGLIEKHFEESKNFMNEARQELNELYRNILERLPNVNMSIKQRNGQD